MTHFFDEPTHKRLSDDSDDDSVDSQSFQVLNTPQNQSTNQHFTFYTRNQETLKPNKQQDSKNIPDMVNQLKQASDKLLVQSKQVQTLKAQNQNYIALYENSQKQCLILKQKLNKIVAQNSHLNEINIQLKQLVSSIKQENEEYIDKINCLQKKYQLERQEIDNKFNNIKRSVQMLTKVPIKNIDNDGFIKLLNIKFGQVEKLLNKIVEIDDMIIDKNQKNKPPGNPEQLDTLQQKLQVMDKIQGLLIKQQNRVNSLRQQNLKLDQLLQQNKKNSGSISSGFGKLFDPVIKFCKIEETREAPTKETEIKKRKENVNM